MNLYLCVLCELCGKYSDRLRQISGDRVAKSIQEVTRARYQICLGNVKIKRICQPVDDAKQKANVSRIKNSFISEANGVQLGDVTAFQLLRRKR